MEAKELLLTAARALGVYVLMLVVIRALGKRTVGNFTAFDLLVALMLGELVDEVIYGDVTIVQGVIAIVVVAAAKYGTMLLSYSSPTMNRVLEGEPTVIVADGALRHDGMREELITEADVMAGLRLQGVSDVREVKRATIEVDGEISVLKQEWAENAQRSDVVRSLAREKSKKTNGEERAPEACRTDSQRALGG
jgi:uncharacterized membrane protein YcaP (DUF421 family)